MSLEVVPVRKRVYDVYERTPADGRQHLGRMTWSLRDDQPLSYEPTLSELADEARRRFRRPSATVTLL